MRLPEPLGARRADPADRPGGPTGAARPGQGDRGVGGRRADAGQEGGGVMSPEPVEPVVLTEVWCHDWRLVVEKDGEHFAATVFMVHADTASYRVVLKATAAEAIESACTFVESKSESAVIARSLKGMATHEVAQKLEANGNIKPKE